MGHIHQFQEDSLQGKVMDTEYGNAQLTSEAVQLS